MEMTDVAQAATEEKKEEKEADHHPYYRPKDAATLILVDRSGTIPKVLVGKRHDNVVFMPGKFVFPGGRVDKADHRIPVRKLERHAACVEVEEPSAAVCIGQRDLDGKIHASWPSCERGLE